MIDITSKRDQHLDQREAAQTVAGRDAARPANAMPLGGLEAGPGWRPELAHQNLGSTVDRRSSGRPAASATWASTRRKFGFGVGRVISLPWYARPSCSQAKSVSPTGGNWRVSLSAVSWLSAHHCAAVTSTSRSALSVSAPAAFRPDASVTATTVKRDEHLDQREALCWPTHGAVDRLDGKGAEAVGRDGDALLVEMQHDALRADERFGSEHDRASADDFGGDFVRKPALRQLQRGGQADEAKALDVAA